MTRPKPLILIILDGWGYRAEVKANAIAWPTNLPMTVCCGNIPTR